jgi:hypothetical protein
MRSDVWRKVRGFTATGIFLFFGAFMAGLAAITLLSPGTPLDELWVLNPIAYKRLAPLGRTVGILFLLLGSDAYAAAEKNDLARSEEARIWKKLSLSTDFETK